MKSKVEYIRGFAKAIRLDEADDNTSRLIKAIIDCLDEMAEKIDEQAEDIEELTEVVDDVRDTLDVYDDILSDIIDDDDDIDIDDDDIYDFGEDEDIWTDDDDDDIGDLSFLHDDDDEDDDDDDDDDDDGDPDVSGVDISDAFKLFDKIINGEYCAEGKSDGEPKVTYTQTMSSDDISKATEALHVMESIFNMCNPSDKVD